jgi:Tol biopolymer transport system component
VIGVRDGQPVEKARTLLSGQTEYETPVWSPDGRAVAVVEVAPEAAAVWTIGTDGREPAERVATSKTPLRVRWHPRTGRMLVSTQRGHDVELFEVVAPDGVLRPISPRIVFGGNPELRDFDISPDGRWLTFCRETAAGDIWLAEVMTPVENSGAQASNTERKR